MSRKRYSSKIIAPKGVMFTQNKAGENIKIGSIAKTIMGSSRQGVIYTSIKKEELPMKITIPHQNLKAKQKKSIIIANHKKYKKESRKEKTLILNDLENLTGYSRKYIIKLLNIHGKTIMRKGKLVMKADIRKSGVWRRGRKKIYSEDIGKILFKIWKMAGGMSSKHLKTFILENYDTLWGSSDLKNISKKQRELLRQISPATIDRLLKPYRDRYKDSLIPLPIKKRRKKSAHLVKGQIDIEIWKEKFPDKAGYIEIDLVEHNGGNPKGEFIYTLCGVDIKTYWVFLRPIKNKARVWTKEAVQSIIHSAPFSVYHIHSDNGSEFINSHLLDFCTEKNIKFTRSREHISNDNPHVENRNMVVVRRYVGYARYDTEKELNILRKLYYYIELRHNFFIPTMRLTHKQKTGKKYKRFYDIKTPYRRVLEDPNVPEFIKQTLKEFKRNLDIVHINRTIIKLYNMLERVHKQKLLNKINRS